MPGPRRIRAIAALGVMLSLMTTACGPAASQSAAPPSVAPPSVAASPGGASPAASPSGEATGPCEPANFPTGEVNITAWTGTDSTAQELGKELVARSTRRSIRM